MTTVMPICEVAAYIVLAHWSIVCSGMKHKHKSAENTVDTIRKIDLFKLNVLKVSNDCGAMMSIFLIIDWIIWNICVILNINEFQSYVPKIILLFVTVCRDLFRWINFKMNWFQRILITNCTDLEYFKCEVSIILGNTPFGSVKVWKCARFLIEYSRFAFYKAFDVLLMA